MASIISTGLANAMMEWLLRSSPASAGGNAAKLQLLTTEPAAATVLDTAFAECTDSGYSAQTVTMNSAFWAVFAASASQSLAAVNFGTASGSITIAALAVNYGAAMGTPRHDYWLSMWFGTGGWTINPGGSILIPAGQLTASDILVA